MDSQPKSFAAALLSPSSSRPQSLPSQPSDPTTIAHQNLATHGTHKGLPSIAFSDSENSSLSKPFTWTLIGKFSHGFNKQDPNLGRPSVSDLQKYFIALDFKGPFQLGLLDNRHLLIQFQREEDYIRMFSRMIWYIRRVTMRIFKWSPFFRVDKESSVVPIWISLPRLPIHLFQKAPLFSIGSIFGHPLRLDDATATLKRPSVARIQVEIDVLKELPEKIWIQLGTQEGFWQPVDFENIPSYCCNCWHIGHSQDLCHAQNLALHSVTDRQPQTHPELKVTDNLKFGKTVRAVPSKHMKQVYLPTGKLVNTSGSVPDTTANSSLNPATHGTKASVGAMAAPESPATGDSTKDDGKAEVTNAVMCTSNAENHAKAKDLADSSTVVLDDAGSPLLVQEIGFSPKPVLVSDVAINHVTVDNQQATDPSTAIVATNSPMPSLEIVASSDHPKLTADNAKENGLLTTPTSHNHLGSHESEVVVVPDKSSAPIDPSNALVVYSLNLVQQPVNMGSAAGPNYNEPMAGKVCTQPVCKNVSDVAQSSNVQTAEVFGSTTNLVQQRMESVAHATVLNPYATEFQIPIANQGNKTTNVTSQAANSLVTYSSQHMAQSLTLHGLIPPSKEYMVEKEILYNDSEFERLEDGDEEERWSSTYDLTDGSEDTIRQKQKGRKKSKAPTTNLWATKEEFKEQSRIFSRQLKKKGRPPGSRNRTYFDVVRTIDTRASKSQST